MVTVIQFNMNCSTIYIWCVLTWSILVNQVAIIWTHSGQRYESWSTKSLLSECRRGPLLLFLWDKTVFRYRLLTRIHWWYVLLVRFLDFYTLRLTVFVIHCINYISFIFNLRSLYLFLFCCFRRCFLDRRYVDSFNWKSSS